MAVSRRGLIGVAASAALAPGAAQGAPAAELVALTSRSGVFTPPRGAAAMQFSFDFPEPSLAVGDYLFGFRVHTFENAYALDARRARVMRAGARTQLACDGLLGAGGQLEAPGALSAEFELGADGVVSWRVRAEAAHHVKSIASIVRGLPRGALSMSCNAFQDYGDDDKRFEYPQLFGAMSTPLALLRAADGRLFELAARQAEVRPARFFFQPGPDGYRVELIYEREGWARAHAAQSFLWRVGPAQSYEAAARAHFAHVEAAYGVPRFPERADAPAWMGALDLVLAVHCAHWTGYVFNDYAKTGDLLRWAAAQIEPSRVLVFLAAWDGRYYWNYPRYQADPRLGGPEGLRRLVREAHGLGYRVALMFGANSANRTWPEFAAFADGASAHVDGDTFDLDWVDWDNDRRDEGLTAFMNLGVASWRRWLAARISAAIEAYDCDAYFLDIAGAWENNPKADMHEGARLLVAELAARHPRVAAIAEMVYDAQMALFPMSQVARYPMYPPGQDAYNRNFEHLSRPAPGRGSTGVHEAGFRRFNPEISPDQRAIPTLAIVDDTFVQERPAMAAYIATAKAWGAARRP